MMMMMGDFTHRVVFFPRAMDFDFNCDAILY